MLRAVLDSSVLISAFLTPKGLSGQVLDAAEDGAFALCLSHEIIAETAEKLLSKAKLRARYGYAPERAEAFCDGLAVVAELVANLPKGRFVPNDPKDDAIVATAVAARADCLVTGDRKHLLSLGICEGVRIVSVREFLDIVSQT
jgi:putative PIN family toxin of toxin-antitoxin system